VERREKRARSWEGVKIGLRGSEGGEFFSREEMAKAR
jgi:hypothetical protein